MRKYSEPEIRVITFDVTDNVNFGGGEGGGFDPGDPADSNIFDGNGNITLQW